MSKRISNSQLMRILVEQNENKSQKKNIPVTEVTSDYSDMHVIREQVRQNTKERNNLYKNIKVSLLYEALNFIYTKSLKGYNSAKKEKIKENAINSFIENKGVDILLSNFKTKSYILSEVSRIVTEYTNILVEKAKDIDPATFTIDKDIFDSFYDELDTEDIGDLSDIIKSRVTNSIEDFIQSNAESKLKIKEILDQTSEKLDSNKGIKESVSYGAKKRINKIKNNKIKNVFECMVISIVENTLKDDTLKQLYFKDNKLDMDSIVEDCETLYTFLEMINTSKMEKVNESYIEKQLESFKLA